MRISFDLDDTLICWGEGLPCEAPLSPLLCILIRDEPLRRGTRQLVDELRARGHEVWVYTSSGRRANWIRWWLRLHGVRVDGIVDGIRHAKCFGQNSLPTKQPHAFGIDLHVDNSHGVAIEGKQYGFNVCVVESCAEDWVRQVLIAVEGQGAAKRTGG